MGDLGLPSSLERASDSGSRSTSWKIKSVILSATRIMIMIVNPHAQSDQSLGVTEVVEPISRVCQRNSQLEAYTKRINYSIQLTTTLASWRLFWSEFGPHQSPFPIPVGHLSTDAVPIKKGVLELVARGRHTIHQSLPKDPKKSQAHYFVTRTNNACQKEMQHRQNFWPKWTVGASKILHLTTGVSTSCPRSGKFSTPASLPCITSLRVVGWVRSSNIWGEEFCAFHSWKETKWHSF